MELTNKSYDNPYKFNGKEMDFQTGLYYYGARYYDPQRSFWLSVDPLVEITMSPYAYTWNDPVNYADPSGMIGERIGDPGGPNMVERVFRWLFGHKSKNKVTVGPATSSREPDLPTFSQAPDNRIPSTFGGAIQNFRDSDPLPGYGAAAGANMIGKGIIDGALDFGNFVRNSFFNKSDYSGLGPRMTKWDGNTMGAEESLNAKFNAILFADGLVTAGVTGIGNNSSLNRIKSLSAEEMANIWGAGPRIDPNNLPKTVTKDFTEILAGRGKPIMRGGVQETVRNNVKWGGALEWKINDIPGSSLNGSRILQHPNGNWGLVIDHDYTKIIQIPTSSQIK
jgi:RHS repeat-associated protein